MAKIPQLNRNSTPEEIRGILSEHQGKTPFILGVTDYETTVDHIIKSVYSLSFLDIYVNNPLFGDLPKEDGVQYLLIEDFTLPKA